MMCFFPWLSYQEAVFDLSGPPTKLSSDAKKELSVVVPWYLASCTMDGSPRDLELLSVGQVHLEPVLLGIW